MSAPHSTGPWLTEAHDMPFTVSDMLGRVIALVPHDEALSAEQSEANARAIAAVPELIAALQAVDEADRTHADVYEAAMGSAHALVRAALRKAGVR